MDQESEDGSACCCLEGCMSGWFMESLGCMVLERDAALLIKTLIDSVTTLLMSGRSPTLH